MKTICPHLAVVRKELLENTSRLEAFAHSLGESRWTRRAASGGWSPAECVIHLVSTSEAFLPRIGNALDRAGEFCECSSRRPWFDPIGWLLIKSIEPPYRMRMRTSPSFEPTAPEPFDAVHERWSRTQESLISLLERGDAYPISRIKLDSPFAARMKYSVLSAFQLIAAHQRRHLWQAEQAAGA